jgi:hypothetical protein
MSQKEGKEGFGCTREHGRANFRRTACRAFPRVETSKTEFVGHNGRTVTIPSLATRQPSSTNTGPEPRLEHTETDADGQEIFDGKPTRDILNMVRDMTGAEPEELITTSGPTSIQLMDVFGRYVMFLNPSKAYTMSD